MATDKDKAHSIKNVIESEDFKHVKDLMSDIIKDMSNIRTCKTAAEMEARKLAIGALDTLWARMLEYTELVKSQKNAEVSDKYNIMRIHE